MASIYTESENFRECTRSAKGICDNQEPLNTTAHQPQIHSLFDVCVVKSSIHVSDASMILMEFWLVILSIRHTHTLLIETGNWFINRFLRNHFPLFCLHRITWLSFNYSVFWFPTWFSGCRLYSIEIWVDALDDWLHIFFLLRECFSLIFNLLICLCLLLFTSTRSFFWFVLFH